MLREELREELRECSGRSSGVLREELREELRKCAVSPNSRISVPFFEDL